MMFGPLLKSEGGGGASVVVQICNNAHARNNRNSCINEGSIFGHRMLISTFSAYQLCRTSGVLCMHDMELPASLPIVATRIYSVRLPRLRSERRLFRDIL